MNTDCLIVIGIITLFQLLDIFQLNEIKKIIQNKSNKK